MEKSQIERINELARKSRTAVGLSEEEKKEQQKLRRLYIDSIKRNVTAMLDNISIEDKL